MESTYTSDLSAGTDVELLMEALGDTALWYAFSTRPILKLEIVAQTVFGFFSGRFMDAMTPYDMDLPMTQARKKLVSPISDNYRVIYSVCARGRDDVERPYLRLLLITDYIYGMTNTFVKGVYREPNGVR